MKTVENEKKYRLVERDIVKADDDDHEVEGSLEFVLGQLESRLGYFDAMDIKSHLLNLEVKHGSFDGLPAVAVAFDNRVGEHHQILYVVEKAS